MPTTSVINLRGMAAENIDSDQYVDGSIDAVHLSANSVDSDAYVDASIDNAHLADDAVGVAELSATGTASSSTFLRGDNAWAAAGGITLGTVVATTSGTTVTFGSIPTGTKRILVSFWDVSTDGTSLFHLQLGDAGGIETSGYTGTCTNGNGVNDQDNGGAGAFVISSTNTTSSDTQAMTGIVCLTLLDASTFTWASSSNLSTDGGVDVYTGGGGKVLSAELTQVKFLTASADTLDQGKINIQYE